jgi:hypothetical protein
VYHFLSDIVVLLHFGFIIFSVAGGILCVWRPKIVWLHVPAAIWAALISFAGWICPLTYLENWLRMSGGGIGYSEGFIVKYLEPIIYPVGLTYWHQMGLGFIVIGLNVAVYAYVLKFAGGFQLKPNNQ